jgi:hypothetical protein
VPVSTNTSIFGSAKMKRPVFSSPLSIVSPKEPTAAATSSVFVPAGNASFSVPGSVPGSTATLCCSVDPSTNGFCEGRVIFCASVVAVVDVVDVDAFVSTSVVAPTGAPIITTYAMRNVAMKPRPKFTRGLRSPPRLPFPLFLARA